MLWRLRLILRGPGRPACARGHSDQSADISLARRRFSRCEDAHDVQVDSFLSPRRDATRDLETSGSRTGAPRGDYANDSGTGLDADQAMARTMAAPRHRRRPGVSAPVREGCERHVGLWG